MAIKKAFVGIHALLAAAADAGKKVSTILDEATELMSAKGAGGGATSVHRNETGDVVAILDYYFKVWLPVDYVEFGAKANSTSGLNTMCKLGTSLWTKQQRDFKKGKELLLESVAAGDVLPTEIAGKLEELEEARGMIEDYPVAGLAFGSIEDLEAATADEMAAALDEYLEALAEAEAEKVAEGMADEDEAEAA